MAYGNNFYNPNFIQGNPYGYQMYQQPVTQSQAQQQVPQQVSQQMQSFRQPMGLQGKIVDSLEAVKAADIPLDGSVTYFALANGEAIATKQLMQDGTSKTIVYKPIDDKESVKEIPKYITEKDFEEKIKKISNNDMKEDLKTIKKQIKDIQRDIDYLNEERRD